MIAGATFINNSLYCNKCGANLFAEYRLICHADKDKRTIDRYECARCGNVIRITNKEGDTQE